MDDLQRALLRQPPPVRHSSRSYNHNHTSSSPELHPRADNAWAPRARPEHTQPSQSSSHFTPRPRPDNDDPPHRRNGFAARVGSHLVPGFRGRSASDVRIAHTPPPDLEPDRLARACGQPAPSAPYRRDDRSRNDSPSARKDPPSLPPTDLPSHPPFPKARVGHMYRRLDGLTRRSGRRAMDYVAFEDVAVTHKRDSNLREQLRRKRSDRLQEKDANFHVIGAQLEDVILYASTPMLIGDYQHHLPVVVVACVEELTKTGIYQLGLFRALPSRDRHLQLIDLYDKSPDFGTHFNMRGQSMPDICALLSTFVSSLPNPLLQPPIYSALWHWSVKPTVKREDARRDKQEEEDENRRARGELPLRGAWMTRNDLHLDDSDIALESDQLAIAQILLRFLPSQNLSLLVYLCAFFTQLPLCPENGLQLEDVARIFGHRLLGGSTKIVSQRMMVWLLTRWHRISETLFSDMCGMTPPPSPAAVPHPQGPEAAVGGENRERVEKRKGKRENADDNALRQSSSSSYTSPPSESPEEHGVSSRKSTSGAEEEMDSSEGSRRRKKRELDVQTRTHAQTNHRSSARKESHHGHVRRSSGSHRNHRRHRGHSPEHKNAPSSPDPFAIAFAKAQQDLGDAPLLAGPSSNTKTAKLKHIAHDGTSSASSPSSPFAARMLDTTVRVGQDASTGRTAVDAGVVDVLLLEAAGVAGAAGVAKALAERVEVLERTLGVRDQERILGLRREDADAEVEVGRSSSHDKGEGDGNSGSDDQGRNKVEDDLRLQLRRVEAERDKAQQVVHDMRAYLLNDPGTLGRG